MGREGESLQKTDKVRHKEGEDKGEELSNVPLHRQIEEVDETNPVSKPPLGGIHFGQSQKI